MVALILEENNPYICGNIISDTHTHNDSIPKNS